MNRRSLDLVASDLDQLRLVERVRGDLHPLHRRLVAEEGHQLYRRRHDGERRRRVVVASERDAGLHGDGVGGERLAERGFNIFEDQCVTCVKVISIAGLLLVLSTME